MRATQSRPDPSILPVADRRPSRVRRTRARHRPGPARGPAGPRHRGGSRVPGRAPLRAHAARARGPGPAGGGLVEPRDRPISLRRAAHRRRTHRAHPGEARYAHAHPGRGTGRTRGPLRTGGATVRPRGDAVTTWDAALVRLREQLADIGTTAVGLNE